MHSKELSILFVEDDETIRIELANFLKKQSFKNVVVAQNGEEGLKKYHEHKPDIILTDLRMPIMDGLEMSKEIKAIDANIPILLITSLFEKEVTEAAVDIGIDGYLFKPISLVRLEMILNKYISRILLQKEFKSEHKLLEEYKGAIDVSASVSKTDTLGVITYVNDAFCKMSGYSREELVGQKHSLVKHPDTKSKTYLDMWKTIINKKVWQGRVKNLKKNGETYYEYSVIVPILNEEDTIQEYIALRQDITDLYHNEQYLKKRIDEEVKKNLLEEKFSIIGRMAAGITHEINTPLTYIRGNLELMIQDINNLDDSIEQKDYLADDSKIALEGVNRIASIVESMREMASQTKEISKPNNVYASLITALTLSYNKAKQISQIRIQNEPFFIGMYKEKFNFIADFQKQRIEQVFIIIINNALDALKHKDDFNSRLLEITIESEFEFIVLRFKDNGGGINEDILSKIFDPFQSSKEEGGMGIGLNVAKRIIKDHGGKIIPTNHENGALFEIYLPKPIQKDKLCSAE
ncbi:MAG: response regulator [Sulfurimonas sp.]|jgi:PAS domain S-box-containing protein